MSGELLVPPGAMTPGVVEWKEANDLSDRLVNGDATLGWPGDPNMRLVRNFIRNRFEVWRLCEDGVDRCVLTKDDHPITGARLDGAALIVKLRDHDTRLMDVIGRVEASNAKVRTDIETAASEQHQAQADQLAHALAKDLDLAAPDGKVYPVR